MYHTALEYLIMSNKDLLKLENEYRNDLPKYKGKPKITSLPKPDALTRRISDFLETSKTSSSSQNKIVNVNAIPIREPRQHVEMDIYMAPIND